MIACSYGCRVWALGCGAHGPGGGASVVQTQIFRSCDYQSELSGILPRESSVFQVLQCDTRDCGFTCMFYLRDSATVKLFRFKLVFLTRGNRIIIMSLNKGMFKKALHNMSSSSQSTVALRLFAHSKSDWSNWRKQKMAGVQSHFLRSLKLSLYLFVNCVWFLLFTPLCAIKEHVLPDKNNGMPRHFCFSVCLGFFFLVNT